MVWVQCVIRVVCGSDGRILCGYLCAVEAAVCDKDDNM